MIIYVVSRLTQFMIWLCEKTGAIDVERVDAVDETESKVGVGSPVVLNVYLNAADNVNGQELARQIVMHLGLHTKSSEN